MEKTKIYDAKIYQELFKTELDTFLFSNIKNKNIHINDRSVYISSISLFNNETVLRRISNYIECGIIELDIDKVHLESLKLVMSNNYNYNPVKFSEVGNNILIKNIF